VPVEPPVVESNGYIDYKVDFVASLSEDQSNSWDEEASFSEADGEPGGDDYYDEECEKQTPKLLQNTKFATQQDNPQADPIAPTDP
jgi:hypothetical protein